MADPEHIAVDNPLRCREGYPVSRDAPGGRFGWLQEDGVLMTPDPGQRFVALDAGEANRRSVSTNRNRERRRVEFPGSVEVFDEDLLAQISSSHRITSGSDSVSGATLHSTRTSR